MVEGNQQSKTLEPASVNRRRFMKALGVGGLGLSGAIQKVYGREPDGVPLVWTRDIYGEPERVRVVPKERYRRLKVYEQLDPNSVIESHPIVDEIGIEQRSDDEEDLAIKLFLSDESPRKRNRLPNEIHDVPVITEVRPTERHPNSGCDSSSGGCRKGTTYDIVEGNIQIGDGSGHVGTLGLVGYHHYSNSATEVLITAHHVMEAAGSIYQAGPKIGDYMSHSSGMDTTKYNLDGTVSSDPRGTKASDQPRITGTWDFAGLSDATSGGTVPCSFAGMKTCYVEDECNATSKNDEVTYEAEFASQFSESGDSGGPAVDSNGKLVATVNFCEWDWTTNHWNSGPVGTELLNSVDAHLYNPY